MLHCVEVKWQKLIFFYIKCFYTVSSHTLVLFTVCNNDLLVKVYFSISITQQRPVRINNQSVFSWMIPSTSFLANFGVWIQILSFFVFFSSKDNNIKVKKVAQFVWKQVLNPTENEYTRLAPLEHHSICLKYLSDFLLNTKNLLIDRPLFPWFWLIGDQLTHVKPTFSTSANV